MSFLRNLFSSTIYNQLKNDHELLSVSKKQNQVNDGSFLAVIKKLVGEEVWSSSVMAGEESAFLVRILCALDPEITKQQVENYDRACRDWIGGRRKLSYAYSSSSCPHWISLFTSLHKEFNLADFKTLGNINKLRRAFSATDDSAMYMRDIKDIAAFYIIYNQMPISRYDFVVKELERAIEEAKQKGVQVYKTRTIEITNEIEELIILKGEAALPELVKKISENPIEYRKAEHNTNINQCVEYVNKILAERGYLLGEKIPFRNLSNVEKLKELIHKVLWIFEDTALIFSNPEELEDYIHYDEFVDRCIASYMAEEEVFLRKLFKAFGFFEKEPVDFVVGSKEVKEAQESWQYVADYRQARACLLFILTEDSIQRELDSCEEDGVFFAENVFSEINDKLAEFGMRTLNKNDTAWNNDTLDWYVHKAVKQIEAVRREQ